MSDTDVIERLRRLNPVPDEPAPPAIAALLERLDDPLPDTSRSRRAGTRVVVPPWRGRRLLLGCAAAAGVGAIALVALLARPGAGTPNVAAAMYQATAPGSGVLHMSTLSERIVGSATTSSREQWWSEQNPRRVRIVLTDSEETIESALTTRPLKLLQWSQSKPDEVVQSVPTGISDTEKTSVQILRELYAKGEITLAGKTTFDGQPAWQLEVHPHLPGGTETLNGQAIPNPIVVVSASTFVPLEFTDYSVTHENGSPELMTNKTHYLAYEELPPNTQDEALLQLAAHPGASVTDQG
jgi:hypothetical protein